MDDFTLMTWLIIILAVLIFGIAKGGFMGSFGMISVPLMSLVISPSMATALTLPLLICADMVNISIWRKYIPKDHIIPLCIYGTVGVILAALLIDYMNDDLFRMIIGLISIIFALDGLFFHKRTNKFHFWNRTIAASTSGFTSYFAHAGGPPFAIWVLKQNFKPFQIQALSAAFFTYINFIKVPGYFINGFFEKETLLISLYVLPAAPIGILFGRYLHYKVEGRFFYIVIYISLLITGIKLCFA